MRIVVLFNPIAGSGRAAAAAADVAAALEAEGHTAVPVETSLSAGAGGAFPGPADAIIVVGGDGTVRMAAERAMKEAAPIYQFPFGTENLFAREFSMRRDLALLLRSVEAFRVIDMDVGRITAFAPSGSAGEIRVSDIFLMMISIGFDAEVIHDLAAHRSGAITHLSYIAPIARQFMRWRPADVSITVDGAPLEARGPGITVIANARQYAFRLDPVPHASISDGLVHVVHIPIRSRWAIPIAALRTRLRRHLRGRDVSHASGGSVALEYPSPQRIQIDGDAFAQPASRIEVSVSPGALRVLLPALPQAKT